MMSSQYSYLQFFDSLTDNLPHLELMDGWVGKVSGWMVGGRDSQIDVGGWMDGIFFL
jgi:hypothetical protein